MKSAKKFIRSVVYYGESSEHYADTRIKIHKNVKRKKSMTFLRDPDSVELAIKKALFQTLTWLRCCEQNIQNLVLEETKTTMF